MGELPGNDVVGIVTVASSGAVDALNAPVAASESVVWVSGSVFDIDLGPREQQSDTITSEERAWAFLPYVPGQGIPAVDETGAPVWVTAIDNRARIRPKRLEALAQRDYKVLGQPELQYTLDGVPDHVWIICEWRAG